MLYLLLFLPLLSLATTESVQRFPWQDSKHEVMIVWKPNRLERTYEDREHKLRITRIEVDENKDGRFDRSWVTHSDLYQYAACDTESASEADALASDVKELKLDYKRTGKGHSVHHSCDVRWGTQFSAILNESMDRGMKCLSELAKLKPKFINRTQDFTKRLPQLWKSDQVKVLCNEDHDWKNFLARASVPGDAIPGTGVSHPFISVSTTTPTKLGAPTAGELKELKITLFHEQLHNLGMLHGQGVESTYGCETCCNPDVKPEEKAVACRVCIGDYKSAEKDRAYLRDMISWGHLYGSLLTTLPQKSVINYMNETGDRRYGIFAMAEANAEIFSPVGAFIAQEMTLRIPPEKQTPEEKKMVQQALRYKDAGSVGEQSTFSATSLALGKSYVAYYYEKNIKVTLDSLEAQIPDLKTLKENSGRSLGNRKYVEAELVSKAKALLYEIWLQDHGKKEISDDSLRAYGIIKKIGML
jgi:hypothetical protein